MTYIASIPNPGVEGAPKILRSDDDNLIARWIKAEDRPGFSIYDCPNPLKPGATRHGKEAIAAIRVVYVDTDFRHIVEAADEIDRRLADLLLTPSELVDSGHGRHIKYELKEEIPCDDPDFERVCALQAALIEYFAGDPQVRPWSLLRRPGTTNSKEEPHVPCRVLRRSGPVDLTELQDMVELVAGTTLLTRKPKPQGNGHDHAKGEPRPAGVDVDARLAAMTLGGPGDSSIHQTQLSVTASLLRAGIALEEATRVVLDATRAAVANDPKWNWRREELGILRMGCDFIVKKPELVTLLPDKWREPFAAALSLGRRPDIGLNPGGFYVRAWKVRADDQGGGKARDKETKAEPEPHKLRFKLVPFAELRPGLEPLYLVDELIPVAGLVDVWGKAKCYKSFWTLDVMLHVAMGWEYRDRYVRQGAVVYCAFEGAHGYKKRVEALRRHYDSPEDATVPLYVMPGQANLIAEHGVLISDISTQLGAVRPAAVVLDTLNKSLFGSENKDVDMGAYVRAAEAIRDAFGCVVVIVHHCGYDDTRPRGHSSLPGAVDAQLAVTRAEEVITVTVEMMRDGPEDTQVVSAVEVIEVGQDQNGKTLTSLAVVPSDADAAARERHGWPRGMSVLHAALKSVLASKCEMFQPEAGVLAVRAADQWFVRDRFYATYAEDEEDTTKRQAKLQKAFVRALADAQHRGIIRIMRTEGGQTMVWLPARGEDR
jgi:hypothetical protein